MNKKILLSLFLVLIVALSISVASAADVDDAAVGDAVDDAIAVDNADEIIAEDGGEGGDEPIPEPETADYLEIEGKVNTTAEGGIVELDEKTYNVGKGKLTITKSLTIQGKGQNKTIINIDGAGQNGTGAFLILKNVSITIKDITFNNLDGKKNYGENVTGYAIQMQANNQVIDNCGFLYFSKGIELNGAQSCNITNSYFTGTATHVENGGDESGSYGIGGRSCKNLLVEGNLFEGALLDGVSIYGGSSNGKIINNVFKDNVYAIFFGGKSTAGGLIQGNQFINCGYVNDSEGNLLYSDLPVISTVKSGDGYALKDNEFQMLSNGLVLGLNSGNTKHGSPSTIGNINITGNTVTAAEGANPYTITFIYMVAEKGLFNPYAPIVIEGNTLTPGITNVKVWYWDWDSENGVVIPAAELKASAIEINELNTADKKITIKLVDINGAGLPAKTISYTINGGDSQTVETDEDGLATVSVDNGVIAFNFESADGYAASSTEINFKATVNRVATSISGFTNTAITTVANGQTPKYLTATLKDANGNLLVNKEVKILTYDGTVQTVKTNAKGVAQVALKISAAGTYNYAFSFAGDDDYKSAFAAVKVTVKKQAVKATFKKATLKVKKAKKVTFTLKDANGKAIAGKKITIKVNGKTFSGKTNAKGVASIKVKVAKKGKVKATAKFAGDSTYNAITKKATFTVKK
jgi:hypothetical protein